jgi:hypothetical protein
MLSPKLLPEGAIATEIKSQVSLLMTQEGINTRTGYLFVTQQLKTSSVT